MNKEWADYWNGQGASGEDYDEIYGQLTEALELIDDLVSAWDHEGDMERIFETVMNIRDWRQGFTIRR